MSLPNINDLSYFSVKRHLVEAFGEKFGSDLQSDIAHDVNRPSLLGRWDSQKELLFEEEVKQIQKESSIQVDWVQGSLGYDRLIDLILYLSRFFDQVYTFNGRGKGGYDGCVQFVPLKGEGFGCSVCFDVDREKAKSYRGDKVYVEFTGQCLSGLCFEDMYQLGNDLIERFGFQCRRIDTCFNDFDRIIELNDILLELDNQNFTGFKKYRRTCERKLENSTVTTVGDMISLGTRGRNGSGKFLRIYDKNLESKGEINCIRYEVEWSKVRAENIFFELFCKSNYDEFSVKLAAFIGGSMSFINRADKPHEKNVKRLEVLCFWKRIVSILGSSKLASPRKISTIEGTKEHCEKNIGRSMALLRLTHKNDMEFDKWFLKIMSVGEGKLRTRDYNALKQYEEQGGFVRTREIERLPF